MDMPDPNPVTASAIYRFGSPFDRSNGWLPGFYASKAYTGEDASMRSKWRTIVFHGQGTLTAWIYIDGVLILPPQSVTMADIWDQKRLINLPRSKSTGYSLRYEYEITSGYVRFVEVFYDPMTADVN